MSISPEMVSLRLNIIIGDHLLVEKENVRELIGQTPPATTSSTGTGEEITNGRSVGGSRCEWKASESVYHKTRGAIRADSVVPRRPSVHAGHSVTPEKSNNRIYDKCIITNTSRTNHRTT